MSHLLEWIHPDANGKFPKQIPLECATDSEKFYYEMRNDHQYKIIRELCNTSKHYNESKDTPSTGIEKEAQCNRLRCGDRLQQKWFIVDNTDVRDVLMDVYCKYKNFFEKSK